MAKLAPSPFATVWTLVALAVAVLALPTAFAADTARGAEPVTEPTAAPKPRRIWSVAIGISDYQYSGRGISDLQYAAADAQAFDKMVANPRFGATGVPPEQRVVLTDKQATLANVRSALLDFLGKAGKDDLVVVLFAGHGSPDPLRPEEMYLLVADTDPTKLASTALPMVEMRRAFERIKSDHVVFFADACHSAAIAMPGTQLRATDAGNRIHHTLGDLSKISRNRVVVTLSEVQEKSMQGRRWQHGVFTWALLQAVDGAADAAADAAGNRDGVIQLSEVIEFIRNRVEAETGFAQHPAIMVIEGYLDRFRVQAWRPQALYLRAWLASEDPTISGLQRAKHFARVVAEAPTMLRPWNCTCALPKRISIRSSRGCRCSRAKPCWPLWSGRRSATAFATSPGILRDGS
ncbi:MAG: hypothetical protein EXR77_13735 [Myxococcales bacterium]|nr:hypothetical protein [Myxococcales bacterium]